MFKQRMVVMHAGPCPFPPTIFQVKLITSAQWTNIDLTFNLFNYINPEQIVIEEENVFLSTHI